MSTGSADSYFEFFPEEHIPVGLELVSAAWSRVLPRTSADKEDKLTAKLARHMKRDKQARRLQFTIDFQFVPIGTRGAVPARIDFILLAGYNEEAYLAFECKRLRIPGTKKTNYNTKEYVGPSGMGRFAVGKYAPTQKHGVMVGYVMDGQVEAAKTSVLKRLLSNKDGLGIVSKDWEISVFLPKQPHLHQTSHVFHRSFVFQHLFLAV